MSNHYYREGNTVEISSTQTSKKIGRIYRIMHDPVYGPQYHISVKDDEQGLEFFWMKEDEICPVQYAAGVGQHKASW